MILNLQRIFIWIGLLSTFRPGNSIKIGMLCDADPNSWQYLFGIGGAMNIAIDQLIDDNVIQNDTVTRYY